MRVCVRSEVTRLRPSVPGASATAWSRLQSESGVSSNLVPPAPGMLTNFKALPLDRIHNMLKMFVTGGEPALAPAPSCPASAPRRPCVCAPADPTP